MRKQIAILLWSTSIASSAQGVGDLFYSGAERDTTMLDEIEVIADTRQDKLKTTTPVQELSAENILLRGITDISDAMRRLPGVTLKDFGGAGGMKTISIRGLGSQHTGITYDGVPVSDIQSGEIDLSQFSLENLSSLSLYIGDGDDIFQSARAQSVSSSLNISSTTASVLPQRPLDLFIKMKVGSFGFLNPSMRLNLSNGSNLATSLSGEFSHAKNNYPFTLKNGDVITRERRNNSELTSGRILWAGLWKPTKRSILKINVNGYNSFQHLPGPVTLYNSQNNERLHKSNIFTNLSYKVSPGEKWNLMAAFKYDFSRTHYIDVKSIYPNGKLDRKYLQNEEYVTITGIYYALHGLSFSYSSDYWHNSFRSNTGISPTRDSWLQSLSVKWQTDKLAIIGRGLYSFITDHTNSESGNKKVSKISPSLSMSYTPFSSIGWSLRAMFKKIMRMPSFNELYYEHYGTLSLCPENTFQYNIGTTVNFSPSSWFPLLEIKIDGYYNEVTNKIVAVPYNLFVWTMTNVGKVEAKGIDISLNTEFSLGRNYSLLLAGGAAYQRASTKSDSTSAEWNKQIPYTPLNSGNMSLTLLNPFVNVSIHSIASSARYSSTANIPSTRIPGYMDTSVSIFRNFNIKETTLEVRFDISNLLDKNYEIVARYPMPGRSFSISAALNLK